MSRELKKVVVAMSGGVDSSVAALLLREQGHEVTGLFMRTGSHAGTGRKTCCSVEDGRDARAVADLLGIPFYALDFEEDFKAIIDDFVGAYGRGRTPNPCILCNRDLKFGKLYEYAAAAGADYVATGHYARVVSCGERLAVARGRDAGKDQSYVLFPLGQSELARTILPVGDLEKREVRERARAAGLSVAEKEESQEICFVPEGDYRRLLESRGVGTPGPFLDGEGQVIGQHQGFEFFTVGQRRGLGQAFGEPRYVVAIRPGDAAVVLGTKDDLGGGELLAAGWVGGGYEAPHPGQEYRAKVQIRYRHEAAPARVSGREDGRVAVRFDNPQEAVTPGQAVVAYEGDRVVGGGWIE
jgi:tRNA-specific 2-thiouridylase